MGKIILSLIFGGFIGWWIGMNMGMKQPLLNNPLVKGQSLSLSEWNIKSVKEDISSKSKTIYKNTKSVEYK